MELLTETQEILDRVVSLTGFPVEIVVDPDLPELARIARARPGMPAHIARINPGRGAPDYLVAYQAGFILRLYELPPEDRFEFAGAEGGREAVTTMVRRSGQLARLSDLMISQLVTQMVDGLLTQLRSIPIGLRIDDWLFEQYPSLRGAQAEWVDQQQRANLEVLKPEVRSFAPKPIWEANVAMNAAFATFSDRLLGRKQYAIPYRATGLERNGWKLLDISKKTPVDPASDRALVDAWADELGLQGWYQWVLVRS